MALSPKWRSFWIGFAGAGVLVALGLLALAVFFWSDSMESVSPALLKEARERWKAANIPDYDLELRAPGGLYHVEVRGGQMKTLIVDGTKANPSEGGYYTVEGLFDTIEAELSNAERKIFGPNQDVRLWMKIDPVLGVPVKFIRQVSGTTQGMTFEVAGLTRR